MCQKLHAGFYTGMEFFCFILYNIYNIHIIRRIVGEGAGMKSLKSRVYGLIRGATVGIAFSLQVLMMVLLAIYLYRGFFIIYLFLELISALTVFALVNNQESYKMWWIIVILIFPVTGFFLYFMWGRSRVHSKEYKFFRQKDIELKEHLNAVDDAMDEISKLHPNKVQITRYLDKKGYPIYTDTDVTYYPTGEQVFEAMLEDLKNARKFIFMEYFIVTDGRLWQDILEILTQKVREGVEVKLLFDDFGVLLLNSKEFRKDMASRGIDLQIYNPIHKRVSRLSFNYRNHQKITVVDGYIGYTGGMNLADEYANYIERFGYWKDTGVRMEGQGVWGLTNIFMEMWEVTQKDYTFYYERYMPSVSKKCSGYVQPFAGGPHRNPDNPTEGAYTRMINKARDYIYITTPYLVLDQKMMSDLTNAAESGVDVRIIVPAIYDKWVVYMVNVSNYGKLIQAGVRVYEYTPGFIHAKNVISDDECAICGTINTDYRSFYHHYECGVFLSEVNAIKNMKEDFLNTLTQCEEIEYTKWQSRSAGQKFMQSTFKLLSPML